MDTFLPHFSNTEDPYFKTDKVRMVTSEHTHKSLMITNH